MFDLTIQSIGDSGRNGVSLLREDLPLIAGGGNKVRITQRRIDKIKR